MNEEGFVLGLHQHLIEKTAARVALRVEHVVLTATGIDEQTEGEREICLLRKIFDGLRTAVFLQREIVFREVADDLAMLVANGDGQRDHFDVNGDGGSGFLSPHRWAEAGKSDQRDHRTNDQRRDDRHKAQPTSTRMRRMRASMISSPSFLWLYLYSDGDYQAHSPYVLRLSCSVIVYLRRILRALNLHKK